MQIQVNGKQETIDKDSVALVELLSLLKVENPEMVSVELNGEFLDRGDFDTTVIKDQDKIEFLYFMGGGA